MQAWCRWACSERASLSVQQQWVLAGNSENKACAVPAWSWAIDPPMGAFWEWQGCTVWDLLAGYVLEVLGELGKEAFSQGPSSSCILKWARKKLHESIQDFWQDVQGVRKGKRGLQPGALRCSAHCPSLYQVGGLRRGSGPTSCWLWAQGSPSLGGFSLRCWEKLKARPQLEGGKTRSKLAAFASFVHEVVKKHLLNTCSLNDRQCESQ